MKKLAFVVELVILNRQTAKSNNESCLFLYFPFLCGLFLERCRMVVPKGCLWQRSIYLPKKII